MKWVKGKRLTRLSRFSINTDWIKHLRGAFPCLSVFKFPEKAGLASCMAGGAANLLNKQKNRVIVAIQPYGFGYY